MDPIAFATNHPYWAFAIAAVIAVIGHKKGWWTQLLAMLQAAPAPVKPLPEDGYRDMASMPMMPQTLAAPSRSEVRAMIRAELEGPEKPDPTGPIADDAHAALELARRHADQHEPLTKVAGDLIKKAAVKPE